MARKRKWRVKKKRSKKRRGAGTLIFVVAAFMLALHIIIEPVDLFPESDFFSGNLTTVQSKEDFLTVLAPYAQTIQEETGVPASISLSQAILESDWGASDLAQKNKNLYGIKGNSDDVYYSTQEFTGKEFITIEAPFRSYRSYYDSMADHAQLLTNGTSWNADQYVAVTDSDSYVTAAYALQKAGYATDPHYAEKLIQLIEDYALYRYDVK